MDRESEVKNAIALAFIAGVAYQDCPAGERDRPEILKEAHEYASRAVGRGGRIKSIMETLGLE